MILLVGKGFVGTAIAQHMDAQKIAYEVASRDSVDFAQKIARCDALINAAGYVGKPNVDACERHKVDCLVGNVMLPVELAKWCETFKKPMVHVSSGCIYFGSKNYTEEDAPNFDKSFYSFTKAAAERALQGFDVRIMRIRMPFLDAVHPRCVLTKLAKYTKWIDGENSITFLPDAARAAVELVKAPKGIYNATNPGTITNRQIAAIMGITPEWWDWEEFYIVGHTPRSFCTLDSRKIQEISKFQPVDNIIAEVLEQRKAA